MWILHRQYLCRRSQSFSPLVHAANSYLALAISTSLPEAHASIAHYFLATRSRTSVETCMYGHASQSNLTYSVPSQQQWSFRRKHRHERWHPLTLSMPAQATPVARFPFSSEKRLTLLPNAWTSMPSSIALLQLAEQVIVCQKTQPVSTWVPHRIFVAPRFRPSVEHLSGFKMFFCPHQDYHVATYHINSCRSTHQTPISGSFDYFNISALCSYGLRIQHTMILTILSHFTIRASANIL